MILTIKNVTSLTGCVNGSEGLVKHWIGFTNTNTQEIFPYFIPIIIDIRNSWQIHVFPKSTESSALCQDCSVSLHQIRRSWHLKLLGTPNNFASSWIRNVHNHNVWSFTEAKYFRLMLKKSVLKNKVGNKWCTSFPTETPPPLNSTAHHIFTSFDFLGFGFRDHPQLQHCNRSPADPYWPLNQWPHLSPFRFIWCPATITA